jgi:hypothetical protein
MRFRNRQQVAELLAERLSPYRGTRPLVVGRASKALCRWRASSPTISAATILRGFRARIDPIAESMNEPVAIPSSTVAIGVAPPAALALQKEIATLSRFIERAVQDSRRSCYAYVRVDTSASIAEADWAPTARVTSRPSWKIASVGMDRMPNRSARSGLSSVLTLTTRALPARCCAAVAS